MTIRMLGCALLLAFALPSFASAALFTTLQNAAVAIGNGAPLTVNDKGTVGVSVTGTFVGTVTFEGSTDANTTWSSVNCTAITTLLTSTTTTTTGQFTCNTAGLTGFRARVSAWTSGSITVTGFPTMVGGGGGASGGSGSATPTLAGCWATVAAPTYLEGTLNALACTLAGYLRVSVEAFNILLSGENQTYNLLEIGWGVVRPTVVASGLLIAADCTSHCTPAAYVALPTGPKTFTSTISSATSGDTIVKQTHTIYAGNTNTFTSDDAVQLCQIVFPATTQYLTKAFVQSCPPVTGNWLYYGVISSNTGSGAGVVTGVVTATY